MGHNMAAIYYGKLFSTLIGVINYSIIIILLYSIHIELNFVLRDSRNGISEFENIF